MDSQKKKSGSTGASAIAGKLKALLEGDKKVKVIVLIGIIGILLILLSECVPKAAQKKSPAGENTAEVSIADYEKALEEKVGTLVSSIAGVGDARVMVTLESGAQNVYATEEKKNTDTTKDYNGNDPKRVQQKENSEEKYIIVDTVDGKQALLKTQIQPQVKGVVVVCEGGQDVQVQQRIIEAVTTALDVMSNRVCVTPIAETADASQ